MRDHEVRVSMTTQQVTQAPGSRMPHLETDSAADPQQRRSRRRRPASNRKQPDRVSGPHQEGIAGPQPEDRRENPVPVRDGRTARQPFRTPNPTLLDGRSVRKRIEMMLTRGRRNDTQRTRHTRNVPGHGVGVQSSLHWSRCNQRGSGHVTIQSVVPGGYGVVATGNPAGLAAPLGGRVGFAVTVGVRPCLDGNSATVIRSMRTPDSSGWF